MQFEDNVYLESGRHLNNKAAFSLPLSTPFLEETHYYTISHDNLKFLTDVNICMTVRAVYSFIHT